MRVPRTIAALLLTALLAGPAGAQFYPPHPLPPPPSPLLYVRLMGPEGVRVTLYSNRGGGRTFPVPCVVGLRPGYIYRIRAEGFPGRREAVLFPSLEVRGTLQLPPRQRAADYPVPLALREEDVRTVQGGAVITKVLVLEHPEGAFPEATRPDQPIEITAGHAQDPLELARERGRPLLIMRLGQRWFTPEEMARQAIPGTLLMPGDRFLAAPACRPWLPWACWPVYDPILGPPDPSADCLKDGGDVGLPAGVDREGQLHGLDPSDTVAVYTDSEGRRKVACSNRICLCVPRFLVIRSISGLAGFTLLAGPAQGQKLIRQELLLRSVPSAMAWQFEQPIGVKGRERLSGTVNTVGPAGLVHLQVLNAEMLEIGPARALGTELLVTLTREQLVLLRRRIELAEQLSGPVVLGGVAQQLPGPAVVGRVEGIVVTGILQGTRSFTVACTEKPVPPPPEKPLLLHKWADRQAAQIGDVVTFYLKYTNLGGRPITDVAVSDSLTARLEYVPGSAKTDRDAVFTMQENEAGSAILRWEIAGKLLPGRSGVLSFQARVR